MGLWLLNMNSKACEAIELQLGKSLLLKCKVLIFYCTLGRLLVLTICEYKPDMLPRLVFFFFFFVRLAWYFKCKILWNVFKKESLWLVFLFGPFLALKVDILLPVNYAILFLRWSLLNNKIQCIALIWKNVFKDILTVVRALQLEHNSIEVYYVCT